MYNVNYAKCAHLSIKVRYEYGPTYFVFTAYVKKDTSEGFISLKSLLHLQAVVKL